MTLAERFELVLADQRASATESMANDCAMSAAQGTRRCPSDHQTPAALAACAAAGCNLASFLAEGEVPPGHAEWAVGAELQAVHADTMAHLRMLATHYERACVVAQNGADRDAQATEVRRHRSALVSGGLQSFNAEQHESAELTLTGAVAPGTSTAVHA
jgi:hypothetical protein